MIEELQKKEREFNEENSNLRNIIIGLEREFILGRNNEYSRDVVELEKSISEENIVVEISDYQEPSPEKVDEAELVLGQEVIPENLHIEKAKKKKSKKK